MAFGDPLEPLSTVSGIEPFQILGGGTIIAVCLVPFLLAFAPKWTADATRTARTSTLLSFGVGIVGAVGYAIPLLTLVAFGVYSQFRALSWLVTFTIQACFVLVSDAVAILALGKTISHRSGRLTTWLGVLVGSTTLVGLSAVPILGPIVVGVVALVGFGASLRRTFGSGVTTEATRAIPPRRRL
ncbi:hypothetical protein Huta_1257 [Halorhabdus utahensis DSM 12940]|uniref:DUF8173 domain-containing protein n=1 Tax=Halorhabdus utahensis (strain DSM 12940 / JCM 11049 / AX-2) TaxID=519442 RepID=C7NN33_HALUD|nr:hypothetical protein [Halorhabdus utahensis]ACV11433.1 hypothetical protein Huta_1257 [Halorhabdus utahensis DSM 12940]